MHLLYVVFTVATSFNRDDIVLFPLPEIIFMPRTPSVFLTVEMIQWDRKVVFDILLLFKWLLACVEVLVQFKEQSHALAQVVSSDCLHIVDIEAGHGCDIVKQVCFQASLILVCNV